MTADTIMKLICNYQQNIEVKKAFEKESKGQGHSVYKYINLSSEDNLSFDTFLAYLEDKGLCIGEKERLYLKERYCTGGDSDFISYDDLMRNMCVGDQL